MTGDLNELFDRAREAVKVSEVAGGKLGRVGHRLRGPCPVCKAGKGKLKDGPFWIDDGKGRWGCFAGQGDCARGGDAVRLEQLLRGGTPREIAETFAGPGYVAPRRVEVVSGPVVQESRTTEDGASEADDRKAASAARLWKDSQKVHPGSLVDRYLSARGLGEAVRTVMIREVRFHPEAFYGFLPDGARVPEGMLTRRLSGGRTAILLPAMLASPRTIEGRTGGVHQTFLAADGSGKARVKKPKSMLGPQKGHGKPGGAWLSPDTSWRDRPLIVGEGIETTGSAAEFHWRRTGQVPRMAAALSLNALGGGWKPDERGRYDVDAPAGDPARPPWTWPDAGEVWGAMDRDMSPVTVPVRGPGGRRLNRTLDADDRARVCGALFTQAWTAAGANPVRVIAPAAGQDFNNELQAELRGVAA